MSASPQTPAPPSGASLLRATLIAMAVAGVLLVTCVLPAEYGIDPTGVGRALGLTQMGEVKLALAEEAASNAAAEASADSVIAAAEASGQPPDAAASGALPPSDAEASRADTTIVTLAPNRSAEIKLVMRGGARATYDWKVSGGVVNFDMHGDSTNAPKGWFVSYRKGTGAAADSGALVADFDGNHGWFWRNRGSRNVEVRLITTGRYSSIEQPR